MKKLFLMILIGLVSCKTSHVLNNIEGSYINKGKDYNYNIVLNNDFTFTFKRQDLDAIKLCTGKWSYLNKDTILIQCDEENIIQQISTGFMEEREMKVIIASHRKIKIDKLFYKKEVSN